MALAHWSAVSSRTGGATRHWRNQRMTSIALLPLGLWFVIALLRQPDLDYATVTAWLAKPLQALLALLFGIAMLWHSLQGIQVILDDYVGGRLRRFSIRLSQLVHIAAAAALVWAIVRLVAGGGT
jgi:succinate dehydrogenase / fumarate reductase membrane anchor subunit